MTSPNTIHRSLALLKLPRSVPPLISVAKAIVRSMTGNASFPNPQPTLAAVAQAIADLEVAESVAQMRTRGAVARRDDRRRELVVVLEQLRGHVQAVADANLENAAALIESAGLAVRKAASRAPRVFAARPGIVSGQVKLVTARVAKRASYDWEYSTDGGKTWLALPSTLQTTTTVSGLQPGSTAYFRHRALIRTGEGDWSQPISTLVH